MRDQDLHDQPLGDRPLLRRIPLGVIVGIAVVLATGSATAWWTLNAYKESILPDATVPGMVEGGSTDSAQTPINPAGSSNAGAIANEQTVQLYWLKDTGTHLELVPGTISVNQASPSDATKAALDELLKGSPTGDVASTIPTDTTLLDLAIESDGIHVDLSKEFTSGGGSASMTGRLAQIIYTATTLDPDAAVWISVEGEPLEVLGGEGLMVSQPMTRREFDANFKL